MPLLPYMYIYTYKTARIRMPRFEVNLVIRHNKQLLLRVNIILIYAPAIVGSLSVNVLLVPFKSQLYT